MKQRRAIAAPACPVELRGAGTTADCRGVASCNLQVPVEQRRRGAAAYEEPVYSYSRPERFMSILFDGCIL